MPGSFLSSKSSEPSLPVDLWWFKCWVVGFGKILHLENSPLPTQWKFLYPDTLHENNISPKNGIFEDDLPFPQVGYVSSLEGNFF